MTHFIQLAVRNFVYLFFPDLCAGCYRVLYGTERGVCSSCRMKLPYLKTKEEQQVILNKFKGRALIDYAYTYLYFSKKGTVQQLIHHLKYRGRKELGFQLGEWFGQELVGNAESLDGVDMLLAVPIHPIRRRQRGYNQSEWIADGLAKSLQVTSRTDVLVRNRFISSQTKKNRLERWNNVATVFEVVDVEAIRNRHILLVDDVITTGATLEACSIALRKAGASRVGIITVAATR